jgi:positive regulator of sigma E activity
MRISTSDIVAVAIFVLVLFIGAWRLLLSYRKTVQAQQALQNIRLDKANRRIAELVNYVDRLQDELDRYRRKGSAR